MWCITTWISKQICLGSLGNLSLGNLGEKEMLARKGVVFCISFTISKCWICGLERAVVLQTGKRAGAEAPFDVYVHVPGLNHLSQFVTINTET